MAKYIMTAEHKQKLAAGRRRKWSSMTDAERREKLLKLHAHNKDKLNATYEAILARKGILKDIHYEREACFGGYLADFYFPKQKAVIDVQNHGFHACPHCKTRGFPHVMERDDKKRALLESRGITVKYVYECQINEELKTNPLDSTPAQNTAQHRADRNS